MSEPPTPPRMLPGEQSMDEILASIRQTLNGNPATEPPKQPEGGDNGVLMLEPSMLVAPEASTAVAAPAVPPPAVPAQAAPGTGQAADAAPAQLVAPAAAAAAASSVGELMRTLSAERTTAITRSGPTIEDLVREEVRPLLKAWLDTHLPTLVERAVRAEIERVIARSSP